MSLRPSPDRPSDNDLLTVDEAAVLLRIGRSTIYKLWRTQQLGSLTIGAKRFTTRTLVERYTNSRIRASVPPGATTVDISQQGMEDEEQ